MIEIAGNPIRRTSTSEAPATNQTLFSRIPSSPHELLTLAPYAFIGGALGGASALLIAFGIAAAVTTKTPPQAPVVSNSQIAVMLFYLAGGAGATFGLAVGLARYGRPVRGFVAASAASLATTIMLGYAQELVIDPSDLQIIVPPYLASFAICAMSLGGLCWAIVTRASRSTAVEQRSDVTTS